MMSFNPQQRRLLWTASRMLLSAAALLWVLHAVPVHVIITTLGAAALPMLLIGFALNFMTRLTAAERTLVISRALGLRVTRWQTIETLFVSNFYALLSPGPVLSGVVTIYRYQTFGASVSGSVGSLLASRAIECASFIALGTLCVLLDPRIALTTVRYPVGLALIAVAAFSVGISCWWFLHRRWSNRKVTHAEATASRSRFHQLQVVFHEVMRHGPRMAFQAAIPAAIQVVLSGAAVSVLAKSVGIDLSLLTSAWMSAAVYAVVLLPISVAGVGVREVTLFKALGLLGVSSSQAVALSVLLFADPLINAMIGGVLQLRATLSGARQSERVTARSKS